MLEENLILQIIGDTLTKFNKYRLLYIQIKTSRNNFIILSFSKFSKFLPNNIKMNDNSPNSRLPPPIHSQLRNFSPQPMNSDLYDPMQQMHIPTHLHQSISMYSQNFQQNSFSMSNDQRNAPSFQNKYNIQTTTYNQFHEYQQTPNSNASVSSGFYCPHCPHCKNKPDETSLATNLSNTSNQYHPMRKPEYRGNFQHPQSTFSNNTPLNYEDPLFKPLFEHPSPPSRPNQHNILLPTYAPKIPPSLENKNFVYSSNVSISSSIRQETPNVYIPPPTLSINIPRNAGRNFQYSNHHDHKRAIRPTSAKSHYPYAEDHPRSFHHNRNGKNQRRHSEENIHNSKNFGSLSLAPQKPESHTMDVMEEFSFKKKKRKLKYNNDEVIDIISSDSPDEGPQISLQELLKNKKANYQPEGTEQGRDENSVHSVIKNFMNTNSDFKKQQEEQKKQEEAEIVEKDEKTQEFAEIISRKEEKVFKDKKPIQQTTRHSKFQKDIMKLITKDNKKSKITPKKKKKKVRRDADPLEKIFDRMRFKNKNLPKKSSSKEKNLKASSFLDDLVNFDLFDPSSDIPKDPRPRRLINSKRNFNELDEEQEHLDHLEKHFRSETLYEDGIGLDGPKTTRNDEEVSSGVPLQSEFYESSADESRYFSVDGEEHGMILECYSNESDFVDIHEVKRRIQDFEMIRQNKENPEEIGDVVYPRKAVIHVGEAYQAHIPSYPSTEHRNCCLLWDPEKLDQESYNRFMWKLSCLLGTSKSKMSEQKAVEILVNQNYNVEQALEFCSSNLDRVKRKILCK